MSLATTNIYKSVVDFSGKSRNSVCFGDNTDFHHSKIIFKGNNNTIKIGDNCFINGTEISIEGDNNTIVLGNDIFILDNTKICVVDGSAFYMGNGCMLSEYIEIRTTDSHAIYDCYTGERINCEENIILHDRVWIGAKVTVLKGAEIAEDSVVGMNSIVTKKFLKPNTIIAGNPAKIIRENIRWTMQR